MTRIVAGTAGGRTLKVPAAGTRPTSERVREAMFSRLEHADVVRDGHVLDLYAGSGALGLEAASRGADAVVLVEHSRQAAEVCRANSAALGLAGRVTVVQSRVERYLADATPSRAFDVVLIDPPYEQAGLETVLDALVRPGWLVRDAVVVVERSTRSGAPAWPAGLTEDGMKRYGETALWYASPSG